RLEAHHVVEEATRKASAEQRHLEEGLSEDERVTAHLKPDELERLFDPLAYQGVAQEFIDRQIAAMKRCELQINEEMPQTMIQSNGAKLNAEIEGPERAPVLMLCNSLGTDLRMWDDQAPALTRHFRLLRYDRRGHGKSEAPKGPYNMEMLGRDALAVMAGM